jgi:hypothetical protein
MSGAPEIHAEVLPAVQLAVLRQLATVTRSEGFYLAGDTGIALQLGHRTSIDFDWFREAAVETPEILAATLRTTGIPFELQQISRGTLHGLALGVATSFFHYPHATLRPPSTWEEPAVFSPQPRTSPV